LTVQLRNTPTFTRLWRPNPPPPQTGGIFDREREYYLPTQFEKESHILLAPRHENCPLSTHLGGEGKGEGGCIFTAKTQKVAFSVIPAKAGIQYSKGIADFRLPPL